MYAVPRYGEDDPVAGDDTDSRIAVRTVCRITPLIRACIVHAQYSD
jgi:hypothetical protein